MFQFKDKNKTNDSYNSYFFPRKYKNCNDVFTVKVAKIKIQLDRTHIIHMCGICRTWRTIVIE